ncbi:hypothetical protein IKF23_02670 [Candidatus Saccharibacteria bacterium]|nr:hypothetical protein [Candidatus Saccharibacteria bacterium]
MKRKISKKNLAAILKYAFCFVATIGVLRYFGGINNIAIFVIVFPLFFFLYEEFSAKYKYFALIYSIILSLIMVIGRQIDNTSEIRWSFDTLLNIVTFTVSLYLPVYKTIGYLEKTVLKRNKVLTKKEKIIIFVLIVVSNLLIYLALFPGIYGWDSALQAYRFMYGGTDSHYSVLLGSVFGAFLETGKNLFGSYDVGMAIAMFLQLLLASAVYAKVVFFVNKKYENLSMTVIAVLYFIFVLLFGAMAVYSTQDTIFGALFALVFIELWEFSSDTSYWDKKWNIVKFIMLSFLMCLCRNNGVYILIIVVMVAFFLIKDKKKVLLMLIPILMSFVYSGPFLGAIGVEKTDTLNEMMSVPSQQMARVYVFDGAMTEEDKEKIEFYYDKTRRFTEYKDFMAKADKTKSSLNSDKVKENTLDYLLLWMRLGIMNPKKYTEAFLLNSLGTWYPGKVYNDPRARIGYIEYGMNTLWDEYDGEFAEMKIERNSLLPFYEEQLHSLLFENEWQQKPILSVIYSIGSYFVLVVFVVMMLIYRKENCLFIPMSLIIGLYITILLGPVAIFRYCYPALIVMPIVIGILFKDKRTVRSKAAS